MLFHQSKFERKKKNYNKTKYSIKSSKNNINYINEKKCNKLKKKKNTLELIQIHEIIFII